MLFDILQFRRETRLPQTRAYLALVTFVGGASSPIDLRLTPAKTPPRVAPRLRSFHAATAPVIKLLDGIFRALSFLLCAANALDLGGPHDDRVH